MNINKLDNAINEALRFITMASKARDRFEKDWAASSKALGLTTREFYSNVSKENAACKRASLDLTRSLAELRK